MIITAWPKKNNNPYCINLYKELESHGITVFGHKESFFGFRKKTQLIHLHWINFIVDRNVILSTIVFFLFFIYLNLLKIFRIKLVWTMHNSFPFVHSDGNKFIQKMVVSLLFRYTDKIIIHSRYQKSHLPLSIRKKSLFIQLHGYNVELKSLPEENRMVFFGGIDPYKGVLELIKEYNRLNLDRYIGLKILGKCSSEEYLHSLLKEDLTNIKFENIFIDHNQLNEEIIKSKFVILPFKKITNSSSLILALNLKKKVLIRNSDLSNEILMAYPELGQVVFTFDDISEIKDIILNKINIKYDDSCFDRFNKNSNIKNIVNNYIALYNDIVKTKI